MAIIVETGTGAVDSEAYADAAAYVAWHTAYYGSAPTATTAVVEGAIRRVVAYLNSLAWNGTRTNGRTQALACPRKDMTDCDGTAIASDTIPREVIYAQHVLTQAEIASPGILSPSGNGARIVSREKVDVIEREFDTSRATGSVDDLRVYVTSALDALRCFIAFPGRHIPWAVVV